MQAVLRELFGPVDVVSVVGVAAVDDDVVGVEELHATLSSVTR